MARRKKIVGLPVEIAGEVARVEQSKLPYVLARGVVYIKGQARYPSQYFFVFNTNSIRTVEQATRLLSFSRMHLYRLCKSGHLRHLKVVRTSLPGFRKGQDVFIFADLKSFIHTFLPRKSAGESVKIITTQKKGK